MVGVGRESDLLDGFRFLRRSLDEELADLPFEVVFADFEEMGGDLLRLVADLARGDGAGGS